MPGDVPEESTAAEHGEAVEKTELELLQEKHDNLSDQLLRTMAEYDNYRKRTQKEKEEIYPNATATAVEKFLPIVDAFERALTFPCDSEDFRKGIEMIQQSLADVLASFGVEAVGQQGDAFDPTLHNAVMHIEDDTLGENVVAQVLQKGYRIGDRVLRYAMVQTAN